MLIINWVRVDDVKEKKTVTATQLFGFMVGFFSVPVLLQPVEIFLV